MFSGYLFLVFNDILQLHALSRMTGRELLEINVKYINKINKIIDSNNWLNLLFYWFSWPSAHKLRRQIQNSPKVKKKNELLVILMFKIGKLRENKVKIIISNIILFKEMYTIFHSKQHFWRNFLFVFIWIQRTP